MTQSPLVCVQWVTGLLWVVLGCIIDVLDVGMHTSVSALRSALPATHPVVNERREARLQENVANTDAVTSSFFLFLCSILFLYLTVMKVNKGTMAALKCSLTWMPSLAVRKGYLGYFLSVWVLASLSCLGLKKTDWR